MAEAEEIQRLRSQLKEREEQVHQAAQAGLDLLNQQMELQNRLEEQRVEMTSALEVCHCTLKGLLTQTAVSLSGYLLYVPPVYKGGEVCTFCCKPDADLTGSFQSQNFPY